MTKTRSTKRALISSGLALFVCISMLVGSTFAWFTDSVTSSGNKIVSGTLNIDLSVMDENGQYQSVKENSDAIFGYTLWEPGYTEWKNIKVSTTGSLALKYAMNIVLKGERSILADVIDVYYASSEITKPANRSLDGLTRLGTISEVLDSTTDALINDTLIPDQSNTVDYATVVLKMQESAGNQYQGKTIGEFDINIFATQYTYEEDSFDNQYDYAAGTEFVGGKGTAEAPYLINEASQLLSISDYDEYTYFKVADGVETLDMTGVGKISLNGSFDGNGVTMNNLTTALFEYVGKVGVEQDIKISNFTANVNTTDGRALVRTVINPGNTTFENVAIHGYIEGKYNVGSFYNYGTANASASDGADYTVSFVNATSDATLVCTSGNIIGGMLGHGYEGSNYKLYINMDANSKYTGTMYTTKGGENCYQVMGMCSHATYFLNGVEVSRYDNKYTSIKLTAADPEAKADGYYVAPVSGADHYVVSLEAQLTAYDENDVKIPNKAGLTWSLGKKTISTGLDGKVFDLVTSGEIVNDKNIAIGYDLNGNALKVYTGRDWNFASGWITLNVTQYDAQGTILATGNVRVHTFAEP